MKIKLAIGLALGLKLALVFGKDDLEEQEKGSCEPTTCDLCGPFYDPGALEQSRVVPDDEWKGPNAMSIKGKILDTSCRPVAGAKVTIWYAGYEGHVRKDGGEPGDYTFPGCPHWPWYRGWMKTDSRGQYSFQATYPYRYSARNIPHVHFRIQVGDQNPTITQLYFKDDIPPNWRDMVKGRESQFAQKITKRPGGKWDLIFNIVESTSEFSNSSSLSKNLGRINEGRCLDERECECGNRHCTVQSDYCPEGRKGFLERKKCQEHCSCSSDCMDCGYCTRPENDCTVCPFDQLKTNFQKLREAYEGGRPETETIDVDVSIKEV